MAESDEMAIALSVLFYLVAQDCYRNGDRFIGWIVMAAAIWWGAVSIIRLFA